MLVSLSLIATGKDKVTMESMVIGLEKLVAIDVEFRGKEAGLIIGEGSYCILFLVRDERKKKLKKDEGLIVSL
jgi:hypothetical protein